MEILKEVLMELYENKSVRIESRIGTTLYTYILDATVSAHFSLPHILPGGIDHGVGSLVILGVMWV